MTAHTKANVVAVGVAGVLSALALAIHFDWVWLPVGLLRAVLFYCLLSPFMLGAHLCFPAIYLMPPLAGSICVFSLGLVSSVLAWFLLTRAVGMRIAHMDYSKRAFYEQVLGFAVIWLLGAACLTYATRPMSG